MAVSDKLLSAASPSSSGSLLVRRSQVFVQSAELLCGLWVIIWSVLFDYDINLIVAMLNEFVCIFMMCM